MFDCSKDIRAFHDQEVTLPQADQTAMRDRRDRNRERLKRGLERDDQPLPEEFVKQGSYSMRTMLQDPDNDYDIDDGVYFLEEDLVGARGAAMSALDARWMVRDAVDDGSFDRPPEVRPNCVRIFYKKGYHVDMPVYRKIETDTETYYELAAAGGWKRSDARDVTAWFEKALSDSIDGPLLRRMVRMLKKFRKCRTSWCSRMLSGFGITVLAIEQQRLTGREDEVLYNMMRAIRDRLDYNLAVAHPVTPNETITSGSDDSKARTLRDKLSEAIGWLDPLFRADCTRNEALACWDKVFNTTFFSERGEDEEQAAAASSGRGILTSAAIIGLEQPTAASVLSSGGGRHA